MKYKYILLTCILFFSLQIDAKDLITKSLINNANKKYGIKAKKRFEIVHKKLLVKLKNAKLLKQLNVVNTWYNHIQYKSDKSTYGVSDYWATLYEFVGKGRGDCEDYTIAKYYTLKELGFNIKRLKFAYVVYRTRNGKRINHMVLAYLKVAKPKSTSDILILDNNNRLVLPASKRKNIVKVIKLINGDTGPKSKKWKKLERNMKRKKL